MEQQVNNSFRQADLLSSNLAEQVFHLMSEFAHHIKAKHGGRAFDRMSGSKNLIDHPQIFTILFQRKQPIIQDLQMLAGFDQEKINNIGPV